MALPRCQNDLIEAVRAVQPNLAVVLHNGAPVELPWADGVPAILEAYLAGEAVGAAVCDVLFGKVNPCAKLAETFPPTWNRTPPRFSSPAKATASNTAKAFSSATAITIRKS